MTPTWLHMLANRLKPRQIDSDLPVAALCDAIPVDSRATFSLGEPLPIPNVVLKGKVGNQARLTIDTRIAANVHILVIGPYVPENVDITIAKVDSGRISINLAGSDIQLNVGKSPRLYCTFGLGADSIVEMGDGTTSSGFEVSCARGRVTIGRNCQTADRTMIMGAAHHGIVRLTDGEPEIVPQSPDVRVGNHVWLGYGAFVGGRADIGDGCIVAAQSSVVSRMPPNCLVAGNPARVRRRNVGWSRHHDKLDPGSREYFARVRSEQRI